MGETKIFIRIDALIWLLHDRNLMTDVIMNNVMKLTCWFRYAQNAPSEVYTK